MPADAIVAAAARATLGAGSARVWACSFSDTGEVWMSSEGLSDFAAYRTRTTSTSGPALEAIVSTLEERFPWLRDDDEADESPQEMVYAGLASFFGSGDAWTVIGDGDSAVRERSHTDPAWILDALSQARISAFPRDASEPVRGEPCERYGFTVDLRDAPVQLPPHPWSGPPRLHGDAWIDGEGRLRRATWLNAYRLRPRWPLNPSPTSGWMTVEFWDLGLPVTIEVPEVERRRSFLILDLISLHRHFHRLRRAHRAALR
jgi:hypothetical protein